MVMSDPFSPTFFLKSPFLQTILASSKLRRLGKNPMLSTSRETVLKTEDGIRLLSYYSPQTQNNPKGLVILLHGWQGDSNSAYILSAGRTLYRHGYAVLRLNYRDHGDSHHLNEGLFFATLLNEVFQCVKQVAQWDSVRPVFLAGFSLGGNFALRIARQISASDIKNLNHIVSISPALDPNKTTDAIDKNKIIAAYFLRKWRRSLRRKQALYPDKYNFSDILNKHNLREMTEILIQRYSNYKNARQYFSEYSILKDSLKKITVPTTIITATDDPIIPVEDFLNLSLNPSTNLVIHRFGGHNGFIEGFLLNAWHERQMVTVFDNIVSFNE